jgi:hypothetical protein
MSSPRIQASSQSSLPFGEEAKPGFRTKTAATRLTPEELGELEAAAESAGQALSEWLRGTALSAARQRPADPSELVLAELWAVRYALLNLFHAAAEAAAEGRQLEPDSVLNIRGMSISNFQEPALFRLMRTPPNPAHILDIEISHRRFTGFDTESCAMGSRVEFPPA